MHCIIRPRWYSMHFRSRASAIRVWRDDPAHPLGEQCRFCLRRFPRLFAKKSNTDNTRNTAYHCHEQESLVDCWVWCLRLGLCTAVSAWADRLFHRSISFYGIHELSPSSQGVTFIKPRHDYATFIEVQIDKEKYTSPVFDRRSPVDWKCARCVPPNWSYRAHSDGTISQICLFSI